MNRPGESKATKQRPSVFASSVMRHLHMENRLGRCDRRAQRKALHQGVENRRPLHSVLLTFNLFAWRADCISGQCWLRLGRAGWFPGQSVTGNSGNHSLP